MTTREAIRRNAQESALLALGFIGDEPETLRRISNQLSRWFERECGTEYGCIVRGRWCEDGFQYDDDGAPYWESAGRCGRSRYTRIPDRERAAMRRLRAIVGQRNGRPCMIDGAFSAADPRGPVTFYIQTDPRGAALYLLRPGVVADGEDVSSVYTRGLCVY